MKSRLFLIFNTLFQKILQMMPAFTLYYPIIVMIIKPEVIKIIKNLTRKNIGGIIMKLKS